MTWEIHNAPGEDNKGDQPYYSFHLPKRHDRVKGVHSSLIREPMKIERRKRVTVGSESGIKSHGKITDVYINQLADGRLMHMNSWINPDGWNTDASTAALTYFDDKQALPAQTESRHIIIYGSRLRHGNSDPLYSELKKTIKYGNGSTLSAGDLYVIEIIGFISLQNFMDGKIWRIS